METLRVSYSSLGTFASCARKFEFNKLFPRRPFDGDSYAADVGKAVHTGYQNYLIHQDRDQATWAFMQAFPFAAEQTQRNDFRSFEAVLSTMEEMFDSVKMGEYELAMIKRPLTRAEIDENTYIESTGGPPKYDYSGMAVPAIEVPFEIRFPGVVIPPCRRFPDGASLSVIGYIDAIMQHLLNGHYQTLDIKTTRENLIDATGKYKFDSQQVPYGIVVDHVAKETIESFRVLYLDCYLDLVDPRVTLYPFLKSRVDINEWATNKLIQFRQIIQYCVSDYFPRTETGCMYYKRPCQFLEPCQTRDASAIEQWFLMGEEAATQEEFVPWIVADVNIGV